MWCFSVNVHCLRSAGRASAGWAGLCRTVLGSWPCDRQPDRRLRRHSCCRRAETDSSWHSNLEDTEQGLKPYTHPTSHLCSRPLPGATGPSPPMSASVSRSNSLSRAIMAAVGLRMSWSLFWMSSITPSLWKTGHYALYWLVRNKSLIRKTTKDPSGVAKILGCPSGDLLVVAHHVFQDQLGRSLRSLQIF